MLGERPYVLRQKVNYREPHRTKTQEKKQWPLWSLWPKCALNALKFDISFSAVSVDRCALRGCASLLSSVLLLIYIARSF